MIYVGHTIHHKEFLSFFLQKSKERKKMISYRFIYFLKTNIVCIIYPKGFISSIQTVKLLVLYTEGISLLKNGKEALRNIAESSGLGRTDQSPSTHFIYFILFFCFSPWVNAAAGTLMIRSSTTQHIDSIQNVSYYNNKLHL